MQTLRLHGILTDTSQSTSYLFLDERSHLWGEVFLPVSRYSLVVVLSVEGKPQYLFHARACYLFAYSLMSVLIFSLLGWVSPPLLQWFLGGHVPSGSMFPGSWESTLQVASMSSPQGLFHWQKAIHPRSHPVLEWSTPKGRFDSYEGMKALLFQSNTWQFWQATLVLGLPVWVSRGHCWAALQLERSICSFPSHPFLRCSSQGHKHPACQTPVQSALWGTQSIMCDIQSSHEPFQFGYGPRHFGRASGMDGYLGKSPTAP